MGGEILHQVMVLTRKREWRNLISPADCLMCSIVLCTLLRYNLGIICLLLMIRALTVNYAGTAPPPLSRCLLSRHSCVIKSGFCLSRSCLCQRLGNRKPTGESAVWMKEGIEAPPTAPPHFKSLSSSPSGGGGA